MKTNFVNPFFRVLWGFIFRCILIVFRIPLRLFYGYTKRQWFVESNRTYLLVRKYLTFWDFSKEDFKGMYGKDFKDKTVLDIGADFGSTANYFLGHGAKKIFAVEGSSLYFRNLFNWVKNNKLADTVIPLYVFLKSTKEFSFLIKHFLPDIVKVDIDGGEFLLLDVSKETFRLPQRYLMEIHSRDLLKRFLEKFRVCGFKITLQYHIKDASLKYYLTVIHVERLN